MFHGTVSYNFMVKNFPAKNFFELCVIIFTTIRVFIIIIMIAAGVVQFLIAKTTQEQSGCTKEFIRTSPKAKVKSIVQMLLILVNDFTRG